jgi:hypothetical protein
MSAASPAGFEERTPPLQRGASFRYSRQSDCGDHRGRARGVGDHCGTRAAGAARRAGFFEARPFQSGISTYNLLFYLVININNINSLQYLQAVASLGRRDALGRPRDRFQLAAKRLCSRTRGLGSAALERNDKPHGECRGAARTVRRTRRDPSSGPRRHVTAVSAQAAGQCWRHGDHSRCSPTPRTPGHYSCGHDGERLRRRILRRRGMGDFEFCPLPISSRWRAEHLVKGVQPWDSRYSSTMMFFRGTTEMKSSASSGCGVKL